jgi:hemoglobin/transferrin/lactoferrin receptor protein
MNMGKPWYRHVLQTTAGALAATALLLPTTGAAETAASTGAETVATGDTIIVTARGTESRASQTPGGVGALDENEIFRSRPISITNAATRMAGVDKSSDSAWGSAISIRGLGRNRVVFLIDGCRVNTATDINAQFGLVDPMDIERIEVLKGPVSALYGSGSLGGVVNIITRKGRFAAKPEVNGTLAATLASNPEGFGLFADTSYNSPDFWVYASGGRRDYDSYEDGSGDTLDNSQFDDYNANVKTGYRWNPFHSTEFQFQHLTGRDIGIPGRGLALPVGPEITYPRTSRTLLQLQHRFAPEAAALDESNLSLYYQEIERRVIMEFPAGNAMDNIRPKADHETWGGRWSNRFDLGDHMLTAGLDAWHWSIESERIKNLSSGLTGIDTPLADAEQLSAGLFAEDNWRLNDRWRLNVGGRIDYLDSESDPLYNWIEPPAPVIPVVLKRETEDHDDITWSAHAGLTWMFRPDWSMTLLTASSYRAPDLMDRFKYLAFSGGELYGNPDLDPERSLFFEYGLHYTTTRLRLSGSVYYNRIDDLITEELESPGIWVMQNVEEAEIYGLEIDADWRLKKDWSLYANAALTRGRNKTSHDDLPFIPPLQGLVGIAYAPAMGFHGRIEMEWAVEQDHVASDEVETPGWAVVNLGCGYRFATGRFVHDLTAGVDNLLDKTYRNHLSTSRGVDLNEPGLNAYAAYKMTF